MVKKFVTLAFLVTIINLWSTVGFVVNSVSETLSRIDFDSGEVEEVFCALGSMPNRVALTEDHAYVVNSGDNSIQKIDLISGDTVADIYIENSSNPYDMIIDDEFAYVTGGMINKVYKIDLAIDEVIGSISVGGNPAGIAILDDKLFVGNSDYGTGYSNCSVSVVNLNSFSILQTIPTEVNPQFLAAINGNIHVSCGGDWNTITGKICIIDPITLTITNTLDIGGATSNFAQMQNDIVYVADGMGASLYAYDANSYQIIYDSSDPFTPGGTMVACDDENLFVLGGEWGQNSTVKVFDPNENLLNEFTVGLYATDIKIMPEVVSADDQQIVLPNILITNYPNPFNPSTTISFYVSQNSEFVNLEVFNIKGQKVKTLIYEEMQKGEHSIIWSGLDSNNKPVSSGIYLYKIKAGNQELVNRMLLLK